MLAVEGDRIGIKQVMDAKRLIDLVQMVHPVAGTDHLAEVAAAYPDQAVIGPAEKGAGQGQRRITGSRTLVMLPRPLQEK